jgi:hypothetical protein
MYLRHSRSRVLATWLVCSVLMALSHTATAMHWYGHLGSAASEQGKARGAQAADCGICLAAAGSAGAATAVEPLAIVVAAPLDRPRFEPFAFVSAALFPAYAIRAPPSTIAR